MQPAPRRQAVACRSRRHPSVSSFFNTDDTKEEYNASEPVNDRSVFRSSIRGEAGVTRASGTRHSSIRFVAGELNPMPTREAPFQCGAAGRGFDHGRVRARPAAILRGDGSFGGFAQCCGYIVPHAKLAVHEEFPDQVAATIQNFLLGA
jgi:hypothetical protein